MQFFDWTFFCQTAVNFLGIVDKKLFEYQPHFWKFLLLLSMWVKWFYDAVTRGLDEYYIFFNHLSVALLNLCWT